jgi:phosphoribosylformimino-5-aminoimidazole carboxamide ribotide isomerase
MKKFTIYPAIDLSEGSVVRLRQGDLSQMTTFYDQPAAAAQNWIAQGAEWLHVVNLDGAFGTDQKKNYAALKDILNVSNSHAKVQFGGGLRDLASIAHVLDLGVERVVIGTAAVRKPALMMGALQTFGPGKIVLGVDALDHIVRVSGWEENTDLSPKALVHHFLSHHLEQVIFTNIKRDGMQTGVDVDSSKQLAEATGIKVIASGGVKDIFDVQKVKAAGLSGVVIGKALYSGQLCLKEALAC